jgi:putative ABC transport system permease protein
MLRIYRVFLRLYPGEFRDEYGRELSLVLDDRLRDESSGFGRMLVWLHAIAGVLVEAPIEQLRVLGEDVRHALRLVRRETATTAAAVLILALGIGAATLVFSLANGLLLRPLPYASSDRLVALDEYSPTDASENGQVALPNFADIRARSRLLEDVGVYIPSGATIRGADSAEVIHTATVTDGTLRALGVQPLYGRLFTRDEAQPSAPRVVIISRQLHQRRFGSDPAVVGKVLETLNQRYTIVGVMPAGFHFPDVAEAWFPLRMDPATSPRTDYFLKGIARLKDGVTVEQADSEMRAMLNQVHAEHQPNNGWIGRARPLRATVAAGYRDGVLTLLLAAALLLAIACGNVANLLLVRATVRRREVAVRTALGATRRRLIRQMVTESLVLGVFGGAAGILLARVGVPALLSLVPIDLPRWMDFSIDSRVLAFAVFVSIATSVVFGTIPALGLSRTAVVETLKAAGRGLTAGRPQRRLRNLVVVAELALSMMLLAGASLAARSFFAVRMQTLGYHASEVLSIEIDRSERAYSTPAAQRGLLDRLRAEVGAVPGVASVAFTSGAPLDDGWGRIFTIEGRPQPLEAMTFINHVVITPGYFSTLGMPLQQGRDFTGADFDAKVLIVSRSFAARHFAGDTVLGKRVRFGPPKNDEPWYTIVGVVADARHGVLKGEDRDSLYLPFAAEIMPSVMLVRAGPDPRNLIAAITARIHGIDKDIAVASALTLEQLVDRRAWQDRLLAVLFVAFAALAVTLAAAGFYAMLAYTVSLQTHEIGLRMALGASASRVRTMVMRQAMTLAGSGLAIGLLAAAALAWLLRTQLYEVSPLDPVSYVIAPAIFLLTGSLAAYLPGRRATRVDPLVALRQE